MKHLATALVLLGLALTIQAAPQCLWGPSYWCQNEQAARQCSRVQYCQQNVWKTHEEPVAVSNTVECEICEFLMTFVDKFIDENATETEVKDALEKICDALPGEFGTECTALINEYFDAIWKLIEEEVEPDTICTLIGLCSSSPKQGKVKSDVGCDICEFIVTYLDKFVDSNTTEEEAEKLVEEVCNLLGAFAEECRDLIDEFFPEIWKLLEEETDPTKICTEIGLCTSSQKAHVPVEVVVPKQSTLCDICELVVSFLKPFVDSNSTEEEVEEALEGLCNILPASIKDTCDDLVKQYFPVIWELVKSEFDNDQICKILGLCPSTTVAREPVPKVKQNLCDICETIVNFIKPYVDSNATEQEVKQALEQFCGLLPEEYQAECNTIVKDYFPTIWKLFEEEFDDDLICKQLGLCPNSTVVTHNPVAHNPLAKSKTSVECELCEMLVKYLKPFVNSSKSEDEVKAALEDVCKTLAVFSANYSKTCEEYVEVYFPMIWELLKEEVDTDELCQMIKACPSTTVAVKSKARDISTACDICKLVSSILKTFVNMNSTENEAKEALEKLCSLLPSTESQECDKLVDSYFPVIWMLVKQEVDSGELCALIGLCPSAAAPKIQQAPDGIITCEVCKLVVDFLTHFLDSNKTEDEVKDAVEEFCKLLPSEYASECESLINEFFPEIWELVMAGTSEVCTVIGVCTSHAVPKNQEFPIVCPLCEMVIEKVVSIISNTPTEDEIADALEKVCDLLPSSDRSLCDDIVSKYTPEIITYLLKGLAPKVVCTLIGLCEGLETKPTVNGDTDCTLCEFFMMALKSYIGDNVTKASVEDALEKLCGIIPSSLRSECDDFVQKYADQIIEMIDDAIDPEKICTEIGLCSSMFKELPPLTFFKVPRRML